MEIKTAEQKLLADFFDLESENEALRQRISELEAAGHKGDESEDGEPAPRQVSMWKLDEPIETAYLSLASQYDYKGENGLNMTADEIEEAIREDAGLARMAERMVGSYSRRKLMEVEVRSFPYKLRVGGYTYALDTYDSGRNIFETRVEKSDSQFQSGRYFPVEMLPDLEEFGLRELREMLTKYASELREKEAE